MIFHNKEKLRMQIFVAVAAAVVIFDWIASRIIAKRETIKEFF
ncbi:hypothetical protein [Deinococcus sp.]|nr:hypothetical protein [Deinococcus sp.]